MLCREEEKQSVKYKDLFRKKVPREEKEEEDFCLSVVSAFLLKSFVVSLYYFERRIQMESVSKEISMKSLYVLKHDL